MPTPKSTHLKYDDLFTFINTGRMKVPQFQRDFIWSKDKTAKLIDSMLKGYPIGTFIIWRTHDRLRSMKNIGSASLPEPPEDKIQYILDGQQRITSLFALRKGAIVNKDGKDIDYKSLWINLDKEPNDNEEFVDTEKDDGPVYISVHDLLNNSISFISDNYDKKYHKKIEDYWKRLTTYDFPTIELDDYALETACEIFTRINTSGQELTLFEIMVAKTYDEKRDFDLAREYDWLTKNDGSEKDLEDAHYDTIPPSTVLQCMAAFLLGQVKGKDILSLDKNEFIDSWSRLKNGIFHAVDFLRKKVGVPVSQLIPYNAIIVVLTYFFLKNDLKPPDNIQKKLLQQYFWRAGFSRRFTSAGDTKIAQDIKKMDKIISGENPDYTDENISLELKDLISCYFSVSDGFCKTILCLYASLNPKSFEDNGQISLDNSWLVRANSRNYHHFFPKNYLKKKGLQDGYDPNCILNITLVEEGLNKGKIKDKAPSHYIANFEKNNPEIEKGLKSHLITNLDTFGIRQDDYPKFLRKRGKKLLREINKRIYLKTQ